MRSGSDFSRNTEGGHLRSQIQEQKNKCSPSLTKRFLGKEAQKVGEGNKVVSIDLGINVLASVVVNDGTWLLYKGVRTKEDYFYFQKRIAQVQSLADIGEYEAYAELGVSTIYMGLSF
jgi:transposase